MRACDGCHWAGLPVREVCPRCNGTMWHEVAQLFGSVHAVTQVHRALGKVFDPPQQLALVELECGGWLVGRGDVTVGARVAVDTDRVVSTAGDLLEEYP